MARTLQWQAEYRRLRPMVERSIAWLTRGNRKVRYRGVTGNDDWLHHRIEPASTAHNGPDPRRHHLGHRLTPRTAQGHPPHSSHAQHGQVGPLRIVDLRAGPNRSTQASRSALRYPPPTTLNQQSPRCIRSPGPASRCSGMQPVSHGAAAGTQRHADVSCRTDSGPKKRRTHGRWHRRPMKNHGGKPGDYLYATPLRR